MPLTISTQAAAELAGCISVRQFRRERDKGIWPAPVNPGGRPERYCVKAMETKLEGGESAKQDTAEQALDRALGIG
jgi:hypothetical protein